MFQTFYEQKVNQSKETNEDLKKLLSQMNKILLTEKENNYNSTFEYFYFFSAV